MSQRMSLAWILPLLLSGISLTGAQGPVAASAPVPSAVASAVDKNWIRNRTLIAFLITDEGTRKVFTSHRGLGESFGSEEHFSFFVAPWRARLSMLPATRQEALDVDVETLQKADGTTTCLMTYHHREPANAITIVKTVWQDENLLKLVFMKGFSNILDDNAARNRKYEIENSYRQAVRPFSGTRK